MPGMPSAARPFTVLFAPASNVLFHVGRCAALAREFAARGHRALLAGSPRYLGDPAVAAEVSGRALLVGASFGAVRGGNP